MAELSPREHGKHGSERGRMLAPMNPAASEDWWVHGVEYVVLKE